MRGRIYDFAFGGNVVHVSHTDNWNDYRLDMCHTQDYGPPQRIIHLPLPDIPKRQSPAYTQHDDCDSHSMRKPLTRRDMPLSLLRVCRQIYHEAALKPFSQTIFVVWELWYSSSRAFLDALVPTQARAIEHIHFVCEDGLCPIYNVMRHVKGLKTLAFHFVEGSLFNKKGHHRFDSMFEQLEKTLTIVKSFDVKSIHISMLVDDTFTAAEKELLAERLERSETSSMQAVA